MKLTTVPLKRHQGRIETASNFGNMKLKKTLLFTIITVIILGSLGCLFFKNIQPGTPGGSSAEENFTAFKEKRLQLPVRQEPVCLVAVGDIMLSRGVAGEIKKHGGDPGHPFAKMKSYLKSGDIVFGNLENPVTPGREIMLPERILRADPGVAEALREAGFTILSLANNHLPDFGIRGILDTFQYLEQAGLKYAGAGRTEREAYTATYTEAKGLKLAFLAFCDPVLVPEGLAGDDRPGVAGFDQDKVQAAVREAREKADIVVVSMHAGTEYEPEPELAQTRFAHMVVDAGADLVLGHHPHVLQRVEEYKGKFILYSLGNFVFDQKWSRATREGLLARIFITRDGVEKVEFLPVYSNDQNQPQLLEGEDAERVLKALDLELEEAAVPAWDQESRVFKEGRSYVFYARRPLPASRLHKVRRYDLDRDGSPEVYSLQDGILEVTDGSRLIWQSQDDWWVDDFFLGDSDNNGMPELNLLVWKAGCFGPHRPFWITEEDYSVKNHLFIFKLVEGVMKPVWQSSNLERPNYEAGLADLDGDGTNELVVVEGDYEDPGVREAGAWRWNGWGFTKISYEDPQDL